MKRLTLEQITAIREYYITHTRKETAIEFSLSVNAVCYLTSQQFKDASLKNYLGIKSVPGTKIKDRLTRLNRELVGKRFCKLTVLEIAIKPELGSGVYAHSQCDCGKLHWGELYGLTHGRTKSCGCLRSANMKKLQRKDNIGITKHYLQLPGGKTTVRNACKWFGVKKVTAYKRIKRGVHPITGLTYK